MPSMTATLKRNAFTLIELITVIVIMGVVALVVAAPAMSNLTSMRASAAASRLASDVRYLQRTAMASGLRTWLVVDAATERYSLYIENSASPGKAGRVGLAHPLDLTTTAVQLNSSPYNGVTITSASFNSTSELEFDSFGTPKDSNAAVLSAAGIVILSNGVAVRVHPVGGYVEHRTWP
jgi:prepilin-type N-terminal cleavage/methylation domain-containing protein